MEIELLLYIMVGQSQTSQRGGCSFSLSDVWRDNRVSKATFYRSVQKLIDSKCIERLWRDHYVLHPNMKKLCQKVGDK